MKEKLIEICKKYIIPEEISTVVRDPYIPYIPRKDWNEVLVLAEAQNLSKDNSSYVAKLKNMSVRERILRLYTFSSDGDIGVAPWDDASLKLAIESSLNMIAQKCAVSNSVFWSQTNKLGKNKNPSWELVRFSTNLWNELLTFLNPKYIITAGIVAKNVIQNVPAGIWSGKHIKFRLPSPTAMSRVSGMFMYSDMLARYPEVKATAEKHPEWVEGKYKHNKLFFACHAVSIIKGHNYD